VTGPVPTPATDSSTRGHPHDVADVARSGDADREIETLRGIARLALASAHEINNPLTVILASLQLMIARGQVPAEATRQVERAIRASEQIRDIVREMSRVTKLEVARHAPAPSSSDTAV